jgi:hypothetical protein
MRTINLAILLGMVVLSFSMAFCAETPKLSEEVLAAKSIAILVRLVDPMGVEPDGFKDLLRARAEDKIRQKNRFQIVTDPAQADLVCLLLVYQPSWTLTKHDPTKYTMLPLANSVIILKGGNSRHWDASPVWTGIAVIINPVAAGKPGDDHRGLLSTFHDYLRRAEKSPKHAGNASQVGNSSERLAADEKTKSMPGRNIFITCDGFCPKSQANRIHRITSANEGQWHVVDEPSQADLVVVWDGQDLYAPGLRVDYYRHFGIMLIFKGGQPDWSATPFAAASGRDAVELFERFAKNIQSFFQ